ncbi:BREX-3 system P-loop-containing protein BrxF [Niallia sp. XMNu-256]|uniref:BREX-3 system P-loop-containing protein BrxF n=1 Tax=Niallia sp. XMNu-256 TaxID=3082444 RepID=UPI0030D3E972
MDFSKLKIEIQEMKSQWHKLLFLCDNRELINSSLSIHNYIKVLNLNLLLSKALLDIPKTKYPMYVEELVRGLFHDPLKIYLLQHIEILFDPALQTHPIRLLENISKQIKIIVVWPGTYENGKLNYAESGYPEYFTCADFEGKVIWN